MTYRLTIPVPRYQNLLNLFFTVLFLVIYTVTVNTPNLTGNFDLIEGLLFIFVFGFFFDEFTKMSFLTDEVNCRYKVGFMFIGFWNAYNVYRSVLSDISCSYIPYLSPASDWDSPALSIEHTAERRGMIRGNYPTNSLHFLLHFFVPASSSKLIQIVDNYFT